MPNERNVTITGDMVENDMPGQQSATSVGNESDKLSVASLRRNSLVEDDTQDAPCAPLDVDGDWERIARAMLGATHPELVDGGDASMYQQKAKEFIEAFNEARLIIDEAKTAPADVDPSRMGLPPGSHPAPGRGF